MDGLRIAAGAISASSTSLDVTANNLANVNTTGFRAHDARFTDGPGGRGVEVGSFAETDQPGPVAFTGRQLDLALQGDNRFFAVRQANGRLAFTRDGAFQIDAQGRLTTPRGDLIDPPITVPSDATSVGVSRDGVVTAARADGSTANLGRIEPVSFPNPEGLSKIGENLAVPTAASGAGERAGGVDILQGALTLSNTDIASEMVKLIRDERTTGANAASFRTQDENLQTILDLKR